MEQRPDSAPETKNPLAEAIPAAVTAPPEPMTPVERVERVEALDILRGVAILGILLVNMQMFFAPMWLMISGVDWWHSLPDRIVEAAILFFAQGKFYTMFSFMFGVGAAIQLERTRKRGRRFGGFFARRLFWLLVIGACHAFLLWFGDILATYALLGFALIPFARRKNITLAVWTIVLFLLPILFVSLVTGAVELARMLPEPAAEMERQFADQRQQTLDLLEEAQDGYPTGSYLEILPLRAVQVQTVYTYIIFGGPGILAMFLIGFNVGRRRFFHDLPANLPKLRRWAPWLLLVGLLANGTVAYLIPRLDQMVPSPALLLQQLCFTLGGPAFCFFYVFGILTLLQREAWQRRLRPVAAVGRMALTNYLTHSLVFTTIANGYGFGQYGKIPPSVGLLMTLAMFLVQIPLSNWWLARFRFGPMEWLWRSLTYWRLQPMRR